MMEPVLLIDIGSKLCKAAIIKNRAYREVINYNGTFGFPSFVFIDKNRQLTVGEVAKSKYLMNPANTINTFINFWGKPLGSEYIQWWKDRVPYSLKEDLEGNLLFEIEGEVFHPAQLLQSMIKEIKMLAEQEIGDQISTAVVGVPFSFNSKLRSELSTILNELGLRLKAIINSTTAAAAFYAFKTNATERIAVWDWGATALRISIAEIRDNILEIIAHKEKTELGGDAVDLILANWMAKKYQENHKKALNITPMVLQRLLSEAQRVKMELTNFSVSHIELPYISMVNKKPTALIADLSAEELDRLMEPLIKKSISSFMELLKRLNLSPNDIEALFIAGGMANKSSIKKIMNEYFDIATVKGATPGHIIIYGLGIASGDIQMLSKEIKIFEIFPHETFIKTAQSDFISIVPCNQPIPYTARVTVPVLKDFNGEFFIYQANPHHPAGKEKVGEYNHIAYIKKDDDTFELEIVCQIDAQGFISISGYEPVKKKLNPLENQLLSTRSLRVISSESLQKGFMIGEHYEILEKIGQGGFTYIYKIRNHSIPRIEALKILKPEHNNDEIILKRFKRSAMGLLGFKNEYVVTIFEIFQFKGLNCIRMEFVDGWDLEVFMKTATFKGLSIPQRISIANYICKAMVELKKKGILHADLKPANIMVTKDDFKAKLIDFELSRFVKLPPVSREKVTGTPKYMSPEHISVESSFGEWSDIYSLGLILYEMLTGEFPHKEQNPKVEYGIFDFHESTPIDPCKIKPELPKDICDVILKCIKKKRSERYQTFEELMLDLAMYEFL